MLGQNVQQRREEVLSTLRLPGLRLGDWSNGGVRSPHVQVSYAYVNNPIHPYIDFSPVCVLCLWCEQPNAPIHPQPHVFFFSIGLVTMQLDLHMCWSCAKYSFYQCQNFYICFTVLVSFAYVTHVPNIKVFFQIGLVTICSFISTCASLIAVTNDNIYALFKSNVIGHIKSAIYVGSTLAHAEVKLTM